jgi:hypothetical protein
MARARANTRSGAVPSSSAARRCWPSAALAAAHHAIQTRWSLASWAPALRLLSPLQTPWAEPFLLGNRTNRVDLCLDIPGNELAVTLVSSRRDGQCHDRGRWWLYHGVGPNLTDTPRVCLSFNIVNRPNNDQCDGGFPKAQPQPTSSGLARRIPLGVPACKGFCDGVSTLQRFFDRQDLRSPWSSVWLIPPPDVARGGGSFRNRTGWLTGSVVRCRSRLGGSGQ